MSSQNKKINLIGNIIYDTVYEVDGFYVGDSNKVVRRLDNLGGILNLVPVLSPAFSVSVYGSIGKDDISKKIIKFLDTFKVDHSNVISHRYRETSSSLIISDILNNVRTSAVSWGACKSLSTAEVSKSSWSHIAYLDSLDNLTLSYLSHIRDNSEIVSADLCKSDYSYYKLQKIIKFLYLLDFLIISDNEARAFGGKGDDLPSICRLLGSMTKKYCVIHSPREVLHSNGQTCKSIKTDYSNKKLNVLGAGDFWASYFISNYLYYSNRCKCSLDEIIAKTNKDTLEFLCKKNTTY